MRGFCTVVMAFTLSTQALGCARGTATGFEATDDDPLDATLASASAADANAPGRTGDEPGDGPEPGSSDDGGNGGSVTVPAGRDGVYAVRRVYQQTQTIDGSLFGFAVNGRLLNTHTIYSLATIGTDGSYVERVCNAHVDSRDGDGRSAMFESTITPNPAIFDNVAPVEHTIALTADGWSIPELFDPVAWRAASSSDPIPTDKNDARVFDLDKDGHPGLTVTISDNTFASGQIYAVQSVRYRAQGTFEGAMLVGQDFDFGEQKVLGGTMAIDTKQRVSAAGDSATNRMHLVKLTAANKALTCKQMAADPGALFPPHPVTP